MKILHVIPSVSRDAGGPSQAIFPMCRALRIAGVDVLVATTDDGLSDSDSRFESVTTRFAYGEPQLFGGVPTIFFPAQLGKSYKYSRGLGAWLDVSVIEFDLVHIHAVFNHACMAAANACRKHGVPYIVRPLGTLSPWSMRQKPLKKWLFWQVRGKQMLTGAAAIHYTSTSEKEATERSLRLNHGRVVPLGTDEYITNVPLQDTTVESHPYVLVLSRLHPKKGLDVLLEAFSGVVKESPFNDWRLILAGDGDDAFVRLLKTRAAEDMANGIVVFSGWVDGAKKRALLESASLLALPSYDENFGVCVIEALACGVPVLVSPHVSLAQEIGAANAGWVANVDKSSLATALREALTSQSERCHRGAAGKKLSAAFTWAKIAPRLFKLYEEVIAKETA